VSKSLNFPNLDKAIPGTDKQLRDFIQWQRQAGRLLETLNSRLTDFFHYSEHYPACVQGALTDAQDLAQQAEEALGKTDVFHCFSEPLFLRLLLVTVPLIEILKSLSKVDLVTSGFIGKNKEELVANLPRFLREMRTVTNACMLVLEKRKREAKTYHGSAPNEQSREKPKRRGRKNADYPTIEREAKLKREWEQARDHGIPGVSKARFAEDKNMTLADFDRLLDRVAKREKYSE
jgi:hypothetical protein